MTRQEVERQLLFETDPIKKAKLEKELGKLPVSESMFNSNYSQAGYSSSSPTITSSTTQLSGQQTGINFSTNSTELNTGTYTPPTFNYNPPSTNNIGLQSALFAGSMDSNLRKFHTQLDANQQKWMTTPQVNANGQFIGDTGNSQIEGVGSTGTGEEDGGSDTTSKGISPEYQKMIGLGATLLNGAVKSFNPVEQNAAYDSSMAMAKQIASVNPYAAAAVQVLDMSNNLFGSKVDKYSVNEEVASRQESSYGGFYDKMRKASEKSGTRVGWLSGLFGGGTAGQRRKNINQAQNYEANITMIDNKNRDWNALAEDPNAYLRANSKKYGTIEPFALSAKQGGVLDVTDFVYEELPTIDSSEWTYQEYGIDKFEKGGSFNIIPEGALHARKHNIELDGITKKGIPVISEGEGGEIQQQAEIEHSEIIYRIEVTQKIEELQKKYENSNSQKEKDEFAIEAGKLLVQETLHNTEDKVGLIDNV